jgi:WD40 repeat protein
MAKFRKILIEFLKLKKQFSYSKVSAHDTDINCVAFNPKSNLLATCGDDMMIKIWSIEESM